MMNWLTRRKKREETATMADFDLLRSAFKRLESDFERLEESVASSLGRISRLKRESDRAIVASTTEGEGRPAASRPSRPLTPFEERAAILAAAKRR